MLRAEWGRMWLIRQVLSGDECEIVGAGEWLDEFWKNRSI